jgi:hypothetical protein
MGGIVSKAQLMHGDMPTNFIYPASGNSKLMTSCLPWSNALINEIAKKYGVSDIISVTELPLTVTPTWNPCTQEYIVRDMMEGIEPRLHHIPMADGHDPSAEQYQMAQQIFSNATGVVWIHCWKGKGRCVKLANVLASGIAPDDDIAKQRSSINRCLTDINESSELVRILNKTGPWPEHRLYCLSLFDSTYGL